MTNLLMHLTTDEIELWAQGLLPAARAMHLADCSLCRVEADRERKVILELVQLPRFAPSAGFAAGGRPSDMMMHNQPLERRGCRPSKPGPQSITALIHGTTQ